MVPGRNVNEIWCGCGGEGHRRLEGVEREFGHGVQVNGVGGVIWQGRMKLVGTIMLAALSGSFSKLACELRVVGPISSGLVGRCQ